MNKEEKTTRIFTGSAIEAQPLIYELEALGITPILRDDHQSGILSGFAAGAPGQIRMYIRNDEINLAKEVIDTYLKSLDKK